MEGSRIRDPGTKALMIAVGIDSRNRGDEVR